MSYLKFWCQLGIFLICLSIQSMAGQPSYIDIKKCNRVESWVIANAKLPEKLIHSCTSEKLNKKSHLVSIDYGAAQDCPAGCFYKNITGVLEGSKFWRVPYFNPKDLFSSLLSNLPEINQPRFNCSRNLWRNVISFRAKKKQYWGWYAEFKIPFKCTWFDIVSTRVDMKNNFHHTGHQKIRKWTGSAFGYLLNNSVKWDVSQVKVNTTKGKETVKIEKHK